MTNQLLNWDKQVFLALNFDGGAVMDCVMWGFSHILSYVVMILFFLFMMKKNRVNIDWKQIGLLILMLGFIVLLADQTSNFFKNNMSKFRPTHTPELQGMVHMVRGYVGGLYGTVSGHAANGFGVAMFMSLVYGKRWMSVSLFTYTVIIAYSRIYLGVHFPLDLIFGTAFGLLYGWIVYLIYIRIINKRIRQCK